LNTGIQTKEEQKDPYQNFTSKYNKAIKLITQNTRITSKIREQAVEIVDDMRSVDRQHYHPRHMAAASVFVAARIQSQPITVRELKNVLEEEEGLKSRKDHETKIWRSVKKIEEVEDLRRSEDYQPFVARDFLPKLVRLTDPCSDTRVCAKNIVEKVHDNCLASGKTQIGLAAATVHLASKMTGSKICLSELSDVVYREENTIRDHAEFLEENLEL